ncbi:MAG: hypothetical protein IKF82_00880 [Bacilli bacterium]|nr:hypothetical protein [Bacilli bacterium]
MDKREIIRILNYMICKHPEDYDRLKEILDTLENSVLVKKDKFKFTYFRELGATEESYDIVSVSTIFTTSEIISHEVIKNVGQEEIKKHLIERTFYDLEKENN